MNALKLLQPIKEKYSGVTYADLFQLASATAVEVVLTPALEVAMNRIYKLIKDSLNNSLEISGSWGPQNSHEVWKSGCHST